MRKKKNKKIQLTFSTFYFENTFFINRSQKLDGPIRPGSTVHTKYSIVILSPEVFIGIPRFISTS